MKNTTPRELSAIANDIRATTESTADVIAIGGLLLEAQGQLDHGEWLPWVARELDFSERTAQRYISAYCFSLKYDTVSDLHLTRSALYQLADGGYDSDEIEAVLAAAAEERVTRDRIDEIVLALEETREAGANESESDGGECELDVIEADEGEPDPEADEQKPPPVAGHMAARAEAEAILDGAPPELPQTEPAPEVDFLTPAFDEAVSKVRELSTKTLGAFRKCERTADEIDAAADFLRQVAVQARGKKTNEAIAPDSTVEDFAQEWARSSLKQKFACATVGQQSAIIRFIQQ